jgi:GT2 family glycosyltransferase
VGDAVFAATLHAHTVATSYSESMLRMVAYDAMHEGRLVRGGGPALLPAGVNTLPEVRNKACAYLLDESKADWLLFVDSDMGFTEDSVDRLLEAADPVERPVVGALCFGLQQVVTDGQGGYLTKPFPTIYDWGNLPGTNRWGFTIRWEYPQNTVTRVAATGAAFLLIHRGILDKLRAGAGDTWFTRAGLPDEPRILGEDMSFCARLGAAGIPLYVHTGVKTTHLKQLWVSEDYYVETRRAAALRQQEPPDGVEIVSG